jgi:hypothetical protein
VGEAKRRRAYELAHAAETVRATNAAKAHQVWIDEVCAEDPGDRADRLAHGFSFDDDIDDPSVVCRNGCGLTYEVVIAGKIELCQSQSD